MFDELIDEFTIAFRKIFALRVYRCNKEYIVDIRAEYMLPQLEWFLFPKLTKFVRKIQSKIYMVKRWFKRETE